MAALAGVAILPCQWMMPLAGDIAFADRMLFFCRLQAKENLAYEEVVRQRELSGSRGGRDFGSLDRESDRHRGGSTMRRQTSSKGDGVYRGGRRDDELSEDEAEVWGRGSKLGGGKLEPAPDRSREKRSYY